MHGVVRYTFIIFGLYTKPNMSPLTQNSGDATGLVDIVYSLFVISHQFVMLMFRWQLCGTAAPHNCQRNIFFIMYLYANKNDGGDNDNDDDDPCIYIRRAGNN